jgi:hypothetical protein
MLFELRWRHALLAIVVLVVTLLVLFLLGPPESPWQMID